MGRPAHLWQPIVTVLALAMALLVFLGPQVVSAAVVNISMVELTRVVMQDGGSCWPRNVDIFTPNPLARLQEPVALARGALGFLNLALGPVPNSHHAWWALGAWRLANCDLAGARAALEVYQLTGPQGNEIGRLYLGIVHWQLGSEDEAMQVWAGGRVPAYFQNLSAFAAKQGRSSAAVEAARIRVRLEPTSVDAHLALGELLRLAGNQAKAKAMEEAQRAALLGPATSGDAFRLGTLFRVLGQREDARYWLTRAIEIDPLNGIAYQWLGFHLVTYGGALAEQGMELIEYALELNPNDHHAWYLLGTAYLRMGRLHEAVDSLKRATDEPQPPAGFSAMLGEAYLQLGDCSQAIFAYRQALQSEPGNVDLAERLQAIEAICLKGTVK